MFSFITHHWRVLSTVAALAWLPQAALADEPLAQQFKTWQQTAKQQASAVFTVDELDVTAWPANKPQLR